MRKIIFCLVLTIIIGLNSYSQKARLNVYGNYVFDDKVDSYYSNTSYFNGKIKGGFQWGGGVEFRLHENYGLELMYLRQDTKVPMEYYDYNENDVKHTNFDLAINYIMAGGVRSMRTSEKAEPFGGLMLGMAILDAKNPDKSTSSSATKFAWGARLGANIWASEKVGIKLQAQILSVPQGAGGGLYFGTGGVGAGVSTYSTMLQFGLGGGLTFQLGGHPQPTTTQTPM
jgi:opacity protein-like surface antigen